MSSLNLVRLLRFAHPMVIRTANLADAERVAALHAASWRSAYRGALSEEYLRGPIDRDRLDLWTQRLREPAPGQLVVVAELDARIRAFAGAFAHASAEWGS